MTCFFRLARALVVPMIIFGSIAAGEVSFGQTSSPSTSQGGTSPTVWLDYFAFEAFFQHVGSEDDRLQKMVKDEGDKPVPTVDYAADIGVDAGAEQTLLAVARDECRKAQDADARLNCHAADRRPLLEVELGSDQAEQVINAAFRACMIEKPRILSDAVIALKNELNEASFTKIDLYVRHEGWVKNRPAPCPGNLDPKPGETSQEGCTSEYLEYFLHIEQTAEWNAGIGVDGRPNKQFVVNTLISLPAEQEQAVIALSAEGIRDFDDVSRRYVEATKEYMSTHHLESQPDRYPTEIEDLNKKHGEVVEQYIAKLREELGESSFTQLDNMLAARKRAIARAGSAQKTGDDHTTGLQP